MNANSESGVSCPQRFPPRIGANAVAASFSTWPDRFEPPHVHLHREDRAAKLRLDSLEFAFVEGFLRHEANDILHITEEHRDEILRAWHKAFGDLSHE